MVRQRQTERAGGDVALLTLTGGLVDAVPAEEEHILRVHEALQEMSSVDARMAQVVEIRYFGGLTDIEIGEALGITDRTGDACKNVKFRVTNDHSSGKTIIIKRVKYFNKSDGRWRTEVVNQNCSLKDDPTLLEAMTPLGTLERNPGLICRHGHECTTAGDNLGDAEGEPLTKFRFIYIYEAAGKRSGEVESGDKEPGGPTCFANKVYSGGKSGWKISGG
jgi:hypothetical protein